MAYWAVARLEPRRERVALYHLGRVGFETYLPRLRERRVLTGGASKFSRRFFPDIAFSWSKVSGMRRDGASASSA